MFVGTDGGTNQVLSIDQALVKFQDGLVSGCSDPRHSLAVSCSQPGDVAGEGVPQLNLHLGQAGVMTRPLPAKLELAVVSPGVNLATGCEGHRVIAACRHPGNLLTDHQHLNNIDQDQVLKLV